MKNSGDVVISVPTWSINIVGYAPTVSIDQIKQVVLEAEGIPAHLKTKVINFLLEKWPDILEKALEHMDMKIPSELEPFWNFIVEIINNLLR